MTSETPDDLPSSEDPEPEIDRDLAGKLFGGGFTALGVGFPVMSAALGALRDPALSSTAADGLRTLVWLLLPAVLICAAQSIASLAVLSGLLKHQRIALYLTFALIGYMLLSVAAWTLASLLS